MKPRKEPSVPFDKFVNESPCPYASSALFSHAPIWDSEVAFAQNSSYVREALDRFVSRKQSDIFVVTINDKSLVKDIPSLSKTLFMLLAYLNQRGQKNLKFPEGIEDLSWDYQFQGVRFFIPVFAPFYPESHPRWSGQAETAYFFFQPDYAFTKHGISSANPHRKLISARVHKLFSQAGKPYSLKLVVGNPKAERYIKPINEEEPAVRWWKMYKIGDILDELTSG